MRNPRINVTLNPSDLEVMHVLCKEKNLSMSSLAQKMIEDWLEEYEDILLERKAEDAEKRWERNGKKTISHEDLCRELDI